MKSNETIVRLMKSNEAIVRLMRNNEAIVRLITNNKAIVKLMRTNEVIVRLTKKNHHFGLIITLILFTPLGTVQTKQVRSRGGSIKIKTCCLNGREMCYGHTCIGSSPIHVFLYQ